MHCFLNIYYVGAGRGTSMSISHGLGFYRFRQKTEKTRAVKKEMDEKVLNSRHRPHLSFVSNMINVRFPTMYLDFACKLLRFPQKKRYEQDKWKSKL